MDRAQPSAGPARVSAIERGPLALAALGMLVLVLGLWAWQHRLASARSAGSALFHGQAGAAFSGMLAGHSEPLPVMASRCSNCHEARAAAPAPAALDGPISKAPEGPLNTVTLALPAATAGASTSYASRLNRESLTQVRRRHGGPPSRYDAAALCKLLRRGVDPAEVMVADEMPRYAASDAQCAQLWAYLAGPGA